MADGGFHVAVIGSGPAGFYATTQLLKNEDPEFSVDLYDRLPTPFGLVRAGVAPDHPKIKNVTKTFDKTAKNERFRFFGHVDLGTDITREELLERYHAVVYAIGTATDRKLGIPGEDLQGSHPATEFVAWYNGHPDHTGLEVDLQAKQVVVVGAGNVAIDIARMLALDESELAPTDTADHAIEVMTKSGIEDITILARRGPLQAAFTNPELREMGELHRADLEVVGEGKLDELSQGVFDDQHQTKRKNVEILQEYAARDKAHPPRPITVRFRFLASPVELLGDDGGHIRAIKIETNEIVDKDGRLAAQGTGEHEELETQLVFRSIGYTGEPIADIPWDEDAGLISNESGRVTDPDSGDVCRGEYVTGWIKRGPSGVIGTNKKDSQDTVAKVIEDAEAGKLNEPAESAQDIRTLLDERNDHVVEWDGWEAIDKAETEAGEKSDPARPRVKLTEWEELREASRAQA